MLGGEGTNNASKKLNMLIITIKSAFSCQIQTIMRHGSNLPSIYVYQIVSLDHIPKMFHLSCLFIFFGNKVCKLYNDLLLKDKDAIWYSDTQLQYVSYFIETKKWSDEFCLASECQSAL